MGGGFWKRQTQEDVSGAPSNELSVNSRPVLPGSPGRARSTSSSGGACDGGPTAARRPSEVAPAIILGLGHRPQHPLICTLLTRGDGDTAAAVGHLQVTGPAACPALRLHPLPGRFPTLPDSLHFF